MPTTENDRRNRQQPVLEHPSLPDHDRRNDPGMHSVYVDPAAVADIVEEKDEEALAPPDQEFGQILKSGLAANAGRIPVDPNNFLTSDPDPSPDQDPENRGDSLLDREDPDRR